ncbi:ABC transporter permease [Streptomyces sp. NPDC093225]|uniref:ABC transporter permease n=1 Tax=Streptomyces sp. NPDC093225 TaxID=3366034 RepID=UPI00380CB0E5
MRNVIRGELRKAVTGRQWWILPLAGTFLCLLSTFGFAAEGHKAVLAGGSAQDVTNDIARSWMMMFLFASLSGAILVSREYGHGTIGRSVLLAGSRTRLLTAKVAVATAAGAVFGLLAAGLGALACATAGLPYGDSPAFTGETGLILAGVFACSLLAAPWGALVGWMLRNQVAAVALLITLTLVVDPGVQALAPDVAKYLLTIAMSAVYHDAKPDLLPVPWAFAAIAGWLTAAWFAAHRLVRTRDII